jgi:hypothetical protein
MGRSKNKFKLSSADGERERKMSLYISKEHPERKKGKNLGTSTFSPCRSRSSEPPREEGREKQFQNKVGEPGTAVTMGTSAENLSRVLGIRRTSSVS